MTMSILQGGHLPANLSSIPGMPPPPGETYDFENLYNRGKTYTAVATIIIVVMILFVANRQYTRYFTVRKMSWDDYKSSETFP